MKNIIIRSLFLLLVMTAINSGVLGQSKLDTILPVRGFCIALPTPENLDEFVNFIITELAPRQVNTLVLRVEYKYKFKSHPELIDTLALSKRELRKIVKACKKNNIRVIPLIDLLGHQSGAKGSGKLLRVYPQFDETPAPKIPDTTKIILNGFNMKSYCPLHPDVHKVLFEVIDEIGIIMNGVTGRMGTNQMTGRRADAVMMAARAGKHVYCEKPIATDLATASGSMRNIYRLKK